MRLTILKSIIGLEVTNYGISSDDVANYIALIAAGRYVEILDIAEFGSVILTGWRSAMHLVSVPSCCISRLRLILRD